MRSLIYLLLVMLTAPSGAQDSDVHTPWDVILSEYLSEHPDGVNRFDYAALRANRDDRESLETYIVALEQVQPSELNDDDAFAYWANLYNAVTIKVILDEAPSNSIRQIRPRPWNIGPWGEARVTVEGETLSLANIEHDILREQFEAALVHYAVNCASIGCPDLKVTAWRGATLQGDLEEAAREYINHPRGVTVTDDGLVISRIYRWFREDFGGDEDGVIAHLLLYADQELAEQIQANPDIDGHEYDWALNRPAP